MSKLLKLIFGDPNEKVLKTFQKDIDAINALEAEIQALTDEQITQHGQVLKERVAQGATLDDVTHEAFALVREAARRTLGQRHYDVQLIGGLGLHRGMIAEMRTGEGKTLTSTLAIFLNALEGKGVHVVTVNDYLAKRDAVWMGQIFQLLGMSVGVIQHEGGYRYDMTFTQESAEFATADANRDAHGGATISQEFLRPVMRNLAYNADITYGTNNQFGFDYLRDNMAMDAAQMVQRGLHFAIVDEIDSILIDEARTPLIISAPADESDDLYRQFAQIVRTLQAETDYNIDEKMRSATFTDAGLKKMEQTLGIENMYAEGGLKYIHHAEQAIRAHAIFRIDKDYVVQDGEVKIVDEFTGRIMEGRRYSEGLHQALEAKEAVEIRRESQTLATITFQNFFRMYTKLGGMTGTAETEAEEFSKIYNLEVLVVPTNKPIVRKDEKDKIFKGEEGKWKAVVEEVKKRQATGQPILLGTASIEKNEMLSTYLAQAGVKHELLNAKNHEREAEIIAEAGRKGAVTVATNMAGRGVDIKLGGLDATPELREEIRELGGLCVIGTERHESRRIDNQLRGRAGRQGDPGFTQFYVSMEDDLIRIFGGERMRNLMNTLGIPDDQPIESGMITSSLEKAQQRVEGHNFDTRKRVLDYDEVLNKHRRSVYGRRASILQNAEFDTLREIRDMIEREAEHIVLFHTGDSIEMEIVPALPDEEVEGDRDVKEIMESLQTLCALPQSTVSELQVILGELSRNKEVLAKQRDDILTIFTGLVEKELAQAVQTLGEKELNVMLRRLMLRAIDQAWVEHLETMQYLRRSIGLRSYGQRDPLVEYNREAFNVFNRMQEDIDRQVATTAMRIVKQSIETNKILDTAPSVMERAKVILQGASETMERKESATQEKRARRAATQLLSQQQQRMGSGLSEERRAALRKKRK